MILLEGTPHDIEIPCIIFYLVHKWGFLDVSDLQESRLPINESGVGLCLGMHLTARLHLLVLYLYHNNSFLARAF